MLDTLVSGRERHTDTKGNARIHTIQRDELLRKFTNKAICRHEEVETGSINGEHTSKLRSGCRKSRAQPNLNRLNRSHTRAEHRGIPVIDVIEAARVEDAKTQLSVGR